MDQYHPLTLRRMKNEKSATDACSRHYPQLYVYITRVDPDTLVLTGAKATDSLGLRMSSCWKSQQASDVSFTTLAKTV